MRVFTEEFVRSIQARYGNKPKIAQPRLYHIATYPSGQSIRDKIERWAAGVAPDILERLLPRLQNCDQHLTACNELLAAYHLAQVGYSLKYESSIGSKTPDFIAVRSGVPAFVVEVYTRDRPAKDQMR